MLTRLKNPSILKKNRKREVGALFCTQGLGMPIVGMGGVGAEKKTACTHAGDSGKYPGCSCVTCNKPSGLQPKETRPYLKALLDKRYDVKMKVNEESKTIQEWCFKHNIYWITYEPETIQHLSSLPLF